MLFFSLSAQPLIVFFPKGCVRTLLGPMQALSIASFAPLPVPRPLTLSATSLSVPLSLFPSLSLSFVPSLSFCPLFLCPRLSFSLTAPSLSTPSLFPYHCCSLPLPLSLPPLFLSLSPHSLSLPLSCWPLSASSLSLFHYTLLCLSLSLPSLPPLYFSLCPSLSLPPPSIFLSAPLSLSLFLYAPSLFPSLCLSLARPLSLSLPLSPLSLSAPSLFHSLRPLFPSALPSLSLPLNLSLTLCPCLSFSLSFSLVIPDISIYLTACTLVLIQYASRLLDRNRDQQA